ncbi:MAG: hypothetical protein AAGE05_10055 [Pseudomonadota bacterium]
MILRPFILAIPLAIGLVACGDGETGGAASADAEAGGANGVMAMPDWFPADFPLPDDFEPESDRQFGASTFMLRGTTAAPLEGLYETLANDLGAAGFQILDRPELVEQDLVYFNGNGWEDSTIRIVDSGDRRTLEISLSRMPG